MKTQEGPWHRTWPIVRAQSTGSITISHYGCMGLALPPVSCLLLEPWVCPGLGAEVPGVTPGPDQELEEGEGVSWARLLPLPAALAPADAPPRATTMPEDPLLLSGSAPGP